MSKALLLSVWYDLSEVTLAEGCDGRAFFRRFGGFSSTEALPGHPGEVFADSAYRGNHFCDAALARGGILRSVATGIGSRARRCLVRPHKAVYFPIFVGVFHQDSVWRSCAVDHTPFGV